MGFTQPSPRSARNSPRRRAAAASALRTRMISPKRRHVVLPESQMLFGAVGVTDIRGGRGAPSPLKKGRNPDCSGRAAPRGVDTFFSPNRRRFGASGLSQPFRGDRGTQSPGLQRRALSDTYDVSECRHVLLAKPRSLRRAWGFTLRGDNSGRAAQSQLNGTHHRTLANAHDVAMQRYVLLVGLMTLPHMTAFTKLFRGGRVAQSALRRDRNAVRSADA